jgi:K(+)-stimulated pyrophosphate-energized sodium pump
MINGEMTYKGLKHKAAVTGDTVGDPFKDTSGPSMNILIKLTCLIGLVMAPILGSGSHTIADNVTCCITTGMCLNERMFGKGCTNMACEHMKGVAMAHDVTKQVTIEKTNVNGAVAATITTTETVKLKHKF